jgi:hypothetical protein
VVPLPQLIIDAKLISRQVWLFPELKPCCFRAFFNCSFPLSRAFITFSFFQLLFPMIIFFFAFASFLPDFLNCFLLYLLFWFFLCVFYGLLCLCTKTFDRPNLSAESKHFSWLSWFLNVRKRSVSLNRKLFYSEKWISKLRRPLLFYYGSLTPLVQTLTCTTSGYVQKEWVQKESKSTTFLLSAFEWNENFSEKFPSNISVYTLMLEGSITEHVHCATTSSFSSPQLFSCQCAPSLTPLGSLIH